ncbi:Wzz/FepE/Etk N-terminal domain-containing protein [Marinobacter sp. chi1]|uniref:Wzz/FepE/Etk N-terminal domain-containing protein n=1 Tax=Marinobacter suaedae TaxID=3057675 RepID=A0ABT8VWF9_9GAMM|nr:Wzz/FepE/Etk N-terminal domain-containing protein [Marinobacter sp. chi1]MDO3720309.1 Wzz/FepE/Etk N-terminal domain-containing protein [Marinobacter sp. chi1]
MHNNQERMGYSEEISLVDLATTFVRRRRVFYISFLVITLLAIIYVLMTPARYEYVSLIQLAEDGKGEYLEAPGTVVANLESRWIPEHVATFTEVNERGLPFEVKATNPKETGLIRLTTDATEEQSDLVSEIHTKLITNVKERQQKLIEITGNTLDKRIASQAAVVAALQAMESSESTALALSSAIQKQAELESDKEALKPAEVLVTSRQSNHGKGPGKALIVALGAILGLMVGVILAFSAEFVALVRDSLSDEQEE